MSALQLVELAVAAALFAAGVWLYRKGAREDATQGSQGAVLLFVVALILAVHGLGLLDYRPAGGL